MRIYLMRRRNEKRSTATPKWIDASHAPLINTLATIYSTAGPGVIKSTRVATKKSAKFDTSGTRHLREAAEQKFNEVIHYSWQAI